MIGAYVHLVKVRAEEFESFFTRLAFAVLLF